MNGTKQLAPGEEAGLELSIPTRLLANFERAEREIQQAYGMTPGVDELARLWLACATASRIRKEFEAAALEINGAVIAIDGHDDSDGDDS